MESRQGQIARQLSQWVGGTIIVLMFAFVIADYLVQSTSYHRQQGRVVKNGVEGLQLFIKGRRDFDEVQQALSAATDISDYIGSDEATIALFDLAGNPLVRRAGNLPGDPDELREIARPARAGTTEIRRLRAAGAPIVVGVTDFETGGSAPARGTAVFILNVAEQEAIALRLWGVRSAMVLFMIVGVMVAVRIPVRRFVLEPIDGLFMAAYAASKDDFRKLPPCPVDNEFSALYEMFGRLMGHLSDTRIAEAAGEAQEMEQEQPLE